MFGIWAKGTSDYSRTVCVCMFLWLPHIMYFLPLLYSEHQLCVQYNFTVPALSATLPPHTAGPHMSPHGVVWCSTSSLPPFHVCAMCGRGRKVLTSPSQPQSATVVYEVDCIQRGVKQAAQQERCLKSLIQYHPGSSLPGYQIFLMTLLLSKLEQLWRCSGQYFSREQWIKWYHALVKVKLVVKTLCYGPGHSAVTDSIIGNRLVFSVCLIPARH